MKRNRQKNLGQNFLKDKNTIEKIIHIAQEEIETLKPKSIIEIGPGLCALTHNLKKISNNQNLPLFLIEKDKNLINQIQNQIPEVEVQMYNNAINFSELLKNSKIPLILMDAASDDFKNFITHLQKENLTPTYIVSNLPYSAGSQILAQCSRVSRSILGLTIMLQKEVALRIVAKPKISSMRADRGSLSLLMQIHFDANLCFDVSPQAFNPPPKVTSTVLRLKQLQNPLLDDDKTEDFESFSKKLFSLRRKMIRSSLQHLSSFFKTLSLEGTERPEVLSTEQIVKLYLYEKQSRDKDKI
jgi:16S rRNA (adenine1518-N6/adenine1519-N6)-dimethyltransferase